MEIRTVTVVGASGTMGANVSAIFAAFGDAKVFMVSRNIESSKKAVLKAIKSVRADSILNKLIPADYSMLADCVKQSDLVFESVIENLDIKLEITKKIAESMRDDAILCSGTSGLSITALAESLPNNIKENYFGVHMFNPPYNMTLCELIATKYSNKETKESLKEFLRKKLYRTVIEVKDGPAFLANRIGFQFINEAMQYAEKYKDSGGIDYIDSILGCFTGRAMAPLVTADFVGLDVHKAIVNNIYVKTNDYAHETFVLPTFAEQLIQDGKLGKKVGAGLYKTEVSESGVKNILVYDINLDEYRPKNKYAFPFAEAMKEYICVGDYAKAIEILISNHSQEAQICLHFLLNYMVYSLVIMKNVAFDIYEADGSMSTGFNWCPPLAMIDVFSQVADVKTIIKERFDKETLKKIDIDEIFSNIKKSNYDYRPYFKSERRGS